ncbi:hypothetical protein [Haloarcula salinisoli]|uniref:Uncharacterized protein n=1 Tax=Haloarcula salinisoli TaxID=2487746 RepID=A0A8J7YC96_9EURY|nr:hypothetical protein [Halomicroarcula salinisoli]MBX0285247.1 hypothetical protein [Halomicroarcula salinisoli]MBX0303275.1 hypothetical protein [Halomicroarcula salinisoli]
MPMKGDGVATDWTETNRWERGASWLAYPDETMQRASHVLGTDAGAIVVDPVDAEGIDELFADFGDVAGVIVLLNRHKRDSAAIAKRHDVPVYVPEALAGVEDDIDAPTERVHRQIPDTDYGVHELTSNAVWQEAALYGDEDDTLVVPEAVGTADYFLAGSERLGVHPMLRLTPPTKLNRLTPERLLVGHGHGIMDDASGALADAVRGSRGRTPGLYVKNLKSFVLG